MDSPDCYAVLGLPEDADVPTIFKFDSTAMPIMNIGVEGDYDRVTLREIAEHLGYSPRHIQRVLPPEAKHPYRRFTDEERERARKLRARGHSLRTLERTFRTSYPHLKRLLGE